MTYDVTFGLKYTDKCPVKTADNNSALTFSCRPNCAIVLLDNGVQHFHPSIGLVHDITARHNRVSKSPPKFTHAYMHVYICVYVKNLSTHSQVQRNSIQVAFRNKVECLCCQFID